MIDYTRNIIQFLSSNYVNGNPLNYQQGTHVIRIPLNCLYHEVKPHIQVPQGILPDPILIDFFYVRQAILKLHDI